MLGCCKPDPWTYTVGNELLGRDPAHCLFVDDDPRLVLAAIQLGYHVVALVRDATSVPAPVPVITSRGAARRRSSTDQVFETGPAGAATLALAAGVDIKVVQEQLGPSTLTRDTYQSVVHQLHHQAADAVAKKITRSRRKTA